MVGTGVLGLGHAAARGRSRMRAKAGRAAWRALGAGGVGWLAGGALESLGQVVARRALGGGLSGDGGRDWRWDWLCGLDRGRVLFGLLGHLAVYGPNVG